MRTSQRCRKPVLTAEDRENIQHCIAEIPDITIEEKRNLSASCSTGLLSGNAALCAVPQGFAGSCKIFIFQTWPGQRLHELSADSSPNGATMNMYRSDKSNRGLGICPCVGIPGADSSDPCVDSIHSNNSRMVYPPAFFLYFTTRAALFIIFLLMRLS